MMGFRGHTLQISSTRWRYAFAVIMAILAILARYAFLPLLGPKEEYITVFPAIVLVAVMAGAGPAILTGILDALAVTYLFEPILSFPAMSVVAIVIITAALTAVLAKRLHLALNKAEIQAQSLKEKNKELEIIIGIVSHDLRAPIVNVKGFAGEIGRDCRLIKEWLCKEPLCKDVSARLAPTFESLDESLNFISSSTQAMDKLTNSLVAVVKAGLMPLKPQHVDMDEVIREVLASIEFKFRQNKASYTIQPKLPPCFGDKVQIVQIFTNLLDNAVKYLDPARPGQVHVSGSLEKGRALYRISDNGIGISEADQHKIFDPYQQLNIKTAGGVGIGLATVKRMVDRNGGTVWLESERGKGTTFFVELPSGSFPPANLN